MVINVAHLCLPAQVRGDKGRKMSKSLGNVVHPLVMIDKYSCELLRFRLDTMKALMAAELYQP